MRSIDGKPDKSLPLWKMVDITLQDSEIEANKTKLRLYEDDFWSNGFQLLEETSGNDSFDIGSAIVSKVDLKLNNLDGKFDNYNFEGAEITPYIYYADKPERACQRYEIVFNKDVRFEDSNTFFSIHYVEHTNAYYTVQKRILQSDLQKNNYKIVLEVNGPFLIRLYYQKKYQSGFYTNTIKDAWFEVKTSNAEITKLSGVDSYGCSGFDDLQFSTGRTYNDGIVDCDSLGYQSFDDIIENTTNGIGYHYAFFKFNVYQKPDFCNMGTFTVIDAPVDYASILSLTAYDEMHKLDVKFDDSGYDYEKGVPISRLYNRLGSVIGLKYQTYPRRNGNSLFDDRAIFQNVKLYRSPGFKSYREFLSCYAQMLCAFVTNNEERNKVSIRWYDQVYVESEDPLYGGYFDNKDESVYMSGGTVDGKPFPYEGVEWPVGDSFNGGTTGYMSHSIHDIDTTFNRTVSTADVVITGVSLTYDDADNNENTVSVGTEEYMIQLENPLVQDADTAQAVVEYIASNIIGMKFRPFNLETLSDPTIQRGDSVRIYDANERDVYVSYVTSNTFAPGTRQKIANYAKPMLRQQSVTADEYTKIYRKISSKIESQVSPHISAVQDFSERIINSIGLHTTVIEAGSSIKIDGIATPVDGAITVMHTKKDPNDKDSVWYIMSGAGFAVSNDHVNFYGINSDGNIIVNVLDALGIKFDWARGGTLTLGGMNDESGVATVVDKYGNEIVRLDENGIDATQGKFSGELIAATGTFKGSLSAAKGTFSGTLNAGTVSSSTIQSSEIKSTSASFTASKQGYSIKIDGNGIYGSSYDQLHLVQTTDKGGGFAGDSHRMAGVEFTDGVTIEGALKVYGAKNRVVDTYTGEKLMYCDEMPSPMFSDCGIITLNEDGIGIVDFDEEFINATNTDVKYIVSLTKNGPGDVWVSEKTESYFVIKGTPNLVVDWVVKGSQRGYEAYRLDPADKSMYEDAQAFIDEKYDIYDSDQYIVEDDAEKLIDELLGELEYEEN